MYLTRVYLNPYRRGCRHLVSSLQRLHAAVLASFPPGVLQTEGEGRVLWRLDRPNDNRRVSRSAGTDVSPGLCLYLSSQAAPDPAALVEQAGYETEGGVVVKKLDDFLAKLEENQVWGFRITVNPTYRRTEDDGRKRLLGHVTVAQQTQWLLDRAEANGFQIPMSAEVGGDLPVLENEAGERVDGRNLLVSLSPALGRGRRVVLVDLGMKIGIVRELVSRGCDVIVVPYNTTAEEVLRLEPDGVMLTNGPGDPEDAKESIEMIKGIIDKVTIFGICMGHQLVSLACGAKTYKLKFGHRGGNHPVKNILTGRVDITSQNHGYAVDIDSLKDTDLELTHIAINDRSCEGVRHKKYPVFTVQFHPEAAAGPHDTSYLFDEFMRS